ncbi:MAG: 23S rRNA (pseudouridine(1915)-N(3))-methyltransferase RlmH [Nonlabens ulvanivorans]|uniref:Ribosomal RNA large subunit methyltransferase H n=4 Tax=Nonlabens ulvanivorans TaxID=906888 RepID=A0A081DF13_NONUL|nr:23S rRNA (pseudouridine(1915)-N(3))-methyltransferase RlmH [Nonlabens ulvanivorans]KEZ93309.1 50S rRNA methyltransferase [Nonlabens ulvanivorans]PRX13566.1 23S rRNA (pseudouridine1915-N3)-methyltransferase [Nonlabens ulvanivorans]GAK77509.1 LSU m3Psi1915 methyltransferase RlmH [Nonlabens ulvanivorans]GAK99981.1 LSU m3Psi1915 methyltransferase RlmH [Nonlabens ulvanivorans]
MKITLLAVGKTDDSRIEQLTQMYVDRLKHYINFELEIIPDLKKTKNLSEDQQKNEEGKLILNKLEKSDFVTLLDERGKKLSSLQFAELINKRSVSGLKRLVFIIGGPYGFSSDVYQRANSKLSLSDMTFSHQMVRLFATEQIYRAFTILRNEPYHHE